MPGLNDLVRLISLDVTRGLVQQGLGLGFDGKRYTRTGSPATLGITNASNTAPIVLTCDRPHAIPPTRADGRANELHAVVQGVLGNTAANAVDETTGRGRSRTVGLNRGVQLVPVNATQFEMYVPGYSTGLLEPLVGNGGYAGGGTITPGLTRGKIFLGSEHARFEQTAPPELVVVPVGNEFADGSRRLAHGAVNFTGGNKAQIERRTIGIDTVIVQLHAWGAASPPDPEEDFDVTQRLYQQFLQSLHLLGVGSFQPQRGVFEDQQERATQRVKSGHYHVTTYAIMTPVLEFSMPFVETPIAIGTTITLQPLDGSDPEIGYSSE